MATYFVLGLDVGYSKKRKSSGLLLAEVRERRLVPVKGPFNLMEVRARSMAREVCEATKVSAIAIDAPLATAYQKRYRPAESVFSKGGFQKHCKPGQTSSPEGQNLHRAGMALVDALSGVASYSTFSKLQQESSVARVVEVFPTAALGVLVSASDLLGVTLRGNRSDAFFDVLWTQYDGQIGCIKLDESLQVRNHDRRMAIVAAALAACLVEGEFSAVGEEASGYFLMPHVSSWKTEWQEQLAVNLDQVTAATLR